MPNKFSELIENNVFENKYLVFDELIEGAQVIGPDWRYVYVNKTVARHGKTTRAELCGSTMMDKYPGIEKTEMFSRLQKCMEERLPQKMLNEFTFSDGSIGWFNLSMQPVEEGVLILSHEITEQKSLERRLAGQLDERIALTSRLNKQNKQLEDFYNMVAHNIQTPISNLLIIQDLLQKSENDNEFQTLLKSQKRVLDGLTRLSKKLNDIVRLRMNYEVKRTKVSLESCVNKAMNVLKGEIIASDASIEYDFREELHVYFPEDYMESIVLNLLENSIRFQRPNRSPEITMRSFNKNDSIYFEISDNGSGIDLDKHGQNMFKLHKTFHDHPEAKGFGLFLTKSLMDIMGGEIEVDSTPGEGTTMTLKVCENFQNERMN